MSMLYRHESKLLLLNEMARKGITVIKIILYCIIWYISDYLQAEQDAEDTKEVLQQTEARLKKALQDRSNNVIIHNTT